jgi:hypothetical protein
LVYITVKLYTSVSAVLKDFSHHTSFPVTHGIVYGRCLHYHILAVEILHTLGRKIHLQPEYIMMFLVDYPSS